MRVLIAVGHAGIYSGGSHQALYQLAGLKRAGVETLAIWGADQEGDPHGFDRLKALGVPLEIIPIHRKPTYKSLRRFREVVRSFQPDVVECVKSGAQYHALFGCIGMNRHALVFYRGISSRMDLFQGLKYRLHRVDRIIGNCRILKRVMAETGRIPESKIDVIYGEYDPACGDPDAVDASGLRAELGIPEGIPVILQLGNWAPWRGQTVTLEAAACLRKEFRQMLTSDGTKGVAFHLLFAGRETHKLSDTVARLDLEDCTTLLPYRRDPERLLKISSIAVNASTANESFSGALLNAQAMGLPAVTSDVGGNTEAIEDGITGFVVPPGDAAALAQALERLLTLPADRLSLMKQRSRQRALDLFSSETRTRNRLQTYHAALAHRA